MLNLLFWLLTLVGIVALVAFAWRSAMRRRGFRLLRLLESEGVLRAAVDVPVQLGAEAGAWRSGWPGRRGTIVLTRKRLAGFSHRARFVLVRGGGGATADAVGVTGDWLVIRPRRSPDHPAPALRFRVPDAALWSRDARRVLRR